SPQRRSFIQVGPTPEISTWPTMVIQRPCCKVGRSWSLAATEGLTVLSCTTPPLALGASPAVQMSPDFTSIPLHCCKAARSSLQVVSIIAQTPAPFSTARSCTTRSVGRGVSPAISTQRAVHSPRRCCQTARYWSREVTTMSAAILEARNCTTHPQADGLSPVTLLRRAAFLPRHCY